MVFVVGVAMEDQIFSQAKQDTEPVPTVSLNVARRRRPRRFNPPLKKDATSSQISASEDNIGTTVLSNNESTDAEELEAAGTSTTIQNVLTKSSRTASKAIQPPQHEVQNSRKRRNHGKKAVGGDSCLTEASKDAGGQEVATSDSTSTNRQTNKRTKKSGPFHRVEERQMDFTSAVVNSTAVPKDFGHNAVESEDEKMEESQYIGVEQVEQSKQIHTVLSYCDESQYAGGNRSPNKLEQEEYIHHGESEENMDDSLVSDMVTCVTKTNTNLCEHNATPYLYCDDLDSNPYQFIPGGQDGATMEYDHDPMADLCVQGDHSQESESDSETTGIPRRQFKIPSARPCTYNFSILPPNLKTKGITSRKKLSTRQKRVTVDENRNTSVPQMLVKEQRNVFDFQPSQDSTRGTDVGDVDVGKGEQWCGRSTLNQSRSTLDVSYSRRTREEQLAVDLEVLQLIAKTRMDIRAIRAKYTAMKTGRVPLPQVTHPTLGAAVNMHVTKPATYEFGQYGRAEQEGYLGLVSATGRKTTMAQEVCRRAQMMKEE